MNTMQMQKMNIIGYCNKKMPAEDGMTYNEAENEQYTK